jgi:hypothetical protein
MAFFFCVMIYVIADLKTKRTIKTIRSLRCELEAGQNSGNGK